MRKKNMMTDRYMLKRLVKKLRFQIRSNRRVDRNEVSLIRAVASGILGDPTARSSDQSAARRVLAAIERHNADPGTDQRQRYLACVPRAGKSFTLNLNLR